MGGGPEFCIQLNNPSPRMKEDRKQAFILNSINKLLAAAMLGVSGPYGL